MPKQDKQTDVKDVTSARRRLLKALMAGGGAGAIGGALPDRWTTPMVDAVLLPAHAQATASNGCAASDPRITCPECLNTGLLTVGALVSWSLDNQEDRVVLSVNLGLGDQAAGDAFPDGSGNFDGSLNQSGGVCPGGGALTQSGTFSGNLNTGNGAISGSFEVSVFCGGTLVCIVTGNFSGTAVFNQLDVPLTVGGVSQLCCQSVLQ